MAKKKRVVVTEKTMAYWFGRYGKIPKCEAEKCIRYTRQFMIGDVMITKVSSKATHRYHKECYVDE